MRHNPVPASLSLRGSILGLIGANGAGGARRSPSDEWQLVFHLAAWRQPGSEIIIGLQRCEMPVTESELKGYMQRFQPYDVVEFEIETHTDGLLTLSSLLRSGVDDIQLKEIANQLQKPIIISHPTFGNLKYEREYAWFTGQITWGKQDIEIMLSCPDPDDARTVLIAASRLFRDNIDWSDRVNDYAVKHLLSTKNDSWLEEDEEILSKEEFLSRMTLESINVDESGGFTFWHDDGGLFWEHMIQVSGNFTEGLTLATISG